MVWGAVAAAGPWNARRLVQARGGKQDYASERACGWRKSQCLFQCLIKAYRGISRRKYQQIKERWQPPPLVGNDLLGDGGLECPWVVKRPFASLPAVLGPSTAIEWYCLCLVRYLDRDHQRSNDDVVWLVGGD